MTPRSFGNEIRAELGGGEMTVSYARCVKLRTIWPREPEFTKWLCGNLVNLGEAIGVTIDPSSAKHQEAVNARYWLRRKSAKLLPIFKKHVLQFKKHARL